MEFHELPHIVPEFGPPPPPTFPCPKCNVTFTSDEDLRVHQFGGHHTMQPMLVFRGRECGRSRLAISKETSASDWVFRNAKAISVNGREFSAGTAATYLSEQRSGVHDVTLVNGEARQEFQFAFALADEEDLQSVDVALGQLVDSGELSHSSIDHFIMRSKHLPTARAYLSGLANYLYGVLAREGSAESGLADRQGEQGYEGRYNQAVTTLGDFDRHPAEAICGIVAFHYSQFPRAAARTRSRRVAAVSLRFREILEGEMPSTRHDLRAESHTSWDHVLSDTVIERVLAWSALPLDGSAGETVEEFGSVISAQRPHDAFKLRLVAAEHYLAVGDHTAAIRNADLLRHGRNTERWYETFRKRVQGALTQ
ncbi:hypothetical protein [Micromonospora sp. NPDC002717]|uniref:hypothetical protein n=1 Tax=Micromonospora sp. NPDC002717 TaxID=3154424 RepID=UPI0033213E10